MSHRFRNSYFELNIDPDQASWHLQSSLKGSPGISTASFRVEFHSGKQYFQSLTTWDPFEIESVERTHRPTGDAQQIHLHVGPEKQGLKTRITFCLLDSCPLLLWQVSLENLSLNAVNMHRITMLEVGTAAKQGSTIHHLFNPNPSRIEPVFFSNGWQSWSYAGAFGKNDRYKGTRLGPATRPVWFNTGTPIPHAKGHITSDMFGVLGDRTTRQGLLAGFLSQKQHFGSLETDLTTQKPQLCMWANGDGAQLDPGGRMTTDWACLQWIDFDTWDPLGEYLDVAALENNLDPNQQDQIPPLGWCSWYQFHQKITPQIIRQNFQAAHHLQSSLPFDLIQIDDGFQAQVGDWHHFSKPFSTGVAPLAREISQLDSSPPLKPGLWLAPFIVHPNAYLNKAHPDWLLRGRCHLPVNAGFIWNTFTRALDLTHPEALGYVREVIRTAVSEWGFPFLKLDFLYAGGLAGRHLDKTRTRAQILRKGLEALREAAGDKTHILACGCPLGSAIGLVNSFRIGADVEAEWLPKSFGMRFPFREETNMPSIRNAVHNALTRLPMHRRWWINDPDCLLLRPTTNLSIEEVHTLATIIALTQGTLLISDHLPDLPQDRLRVAEVLIPVLNQAPKVIDWLDTPTPRRLRLDLSNETGRWHLLALFNWADIPRRIEMNLSDFGLDPHKEYFLRSFWDGEIVRMTSKVHNFEAVPAHASLLLAVRQVLPGIPLYLGSDLHISQGLEISAWEPDNHEVRFPIHRPGHAQGKIYLHLPFPPVEAVCNQESIPWTNLSPGIYQFTVKFERGAQLRVRW